MTQTQTRAASIELVRGTTQTELRKMDKESLEKVYQTITGGSFTGTKKELVKAVKAVADAADTDPEVTDRRARQRALDLESYDAYQEHGSYAEAARQLGIRWETVWGRVKREAERRA